MPDVTQPWFLSRFNSILVISRSTKFTCDFLPESGTTSWQGAQIREIETHTKWFFQLLCHKYIAFSIPNCLLCEF